MYPAGSAETRAKDGGPFQLDSSDSRDRTRPYSFQSARMLPMAVGIPFRPSKTKPPLAESRRTSAACRH